MALPLKIHEHELTLGSAVRRYLTAVPRPALADDSALRSLGRSLPLHLLSSEPADQRIILAVGVATFVCGFLAGALANAYLLAIHHPLVENYRSTLSYGSAIIGD